jgi:8-oxo-dGTP diphosphatase
MQKRIEEGPTKGLWEFPGGKIETQETPFQALKREVEEEVGIQHVEESQARLINIHSYLSHDMQKRFLLHVFLLKPSHDQCSILKERGRWFLLDDQTYSQTINGLIPEANHSVINFAIDFYKSYTREPSIPFEESLLWSLPQYYA